MPAGSRWRSPSPSSIRFELQGGFGWLLGLGCTCPLSLSRGGFFPPWSGINPRWIGKAQVGEHLTDEVMRSPGGGAVGRLVQALMQASHREGALLARGTEREREEGGRALFC